jgi:hypothetical protein
MNLLDSEGEFTWPNSDRHQSICMFLITLLLNRISLTLCRYVGEILMSLMVGEGEVTWPNGGRHRSIFMFQITLLFYRIMFNALQIPGRDPDEPNEW